MTSYFHHLRWPDRAPAGRRGDTAPEARRGCCRPRDRHSGRRRFRPGCAHSHCRPRPGPASRQGPRPARPPGPGAPATKGTTPRPGADPGRMARPWRCGRDTEGMQAFVGAGAGFLLAVLWFDLMFDVQVAGHVGAVLPDPVLGSIAAYYRRVTTEARPMNRLVAAAM